MACEIFICEIGVGSSYPEEVTEAITRNGEVLKVTIAKEQERRWAHIQVIQIASRA